MSTTTNTGRTIAFIGTGVIGASRDNLRFAPSITEAVRGAQFIQENGPERVEDIDTAISYGPGLRWASATSC
jgi:hypothetical protein